ncbi:hypothetical protein FACS1894219_08800 [Clostridia bacterium]|nr:hypothetical protein FACS1894219_08800 [Clostridia bacterium]
MWFDTKKIEETPEAVIYEYGYETHELTGRFVLSKNDDKLILLQRDKDYSQSRFDWITGHVCYRFPKENYPDKRMIATG